MQQNSFSTLGCHFWRLLSVPPPAFWLIVKDVSSFLNTVRSSPKADQCQASLLLNQQVIQVKGIVLHSTL